MHALLPFIVLVQLAGRCQEIIPRVLLCLNKVVQRFSVSALCLCCTRIQWISWCYNFIHFIQQSSCDKEHVKILLRRASEVISVLKMPNVTVAVLFAGKGNYLDSTANLTAASFIIERASELAKWCTYSKYIIANIWLKYIPNVHDNEWMIIIVHVQLSETQCTLCTSSS